MALELNTAVDVSTVQGCFNPFMPIDGVGISNTLIAQFKYGGFNPFMPIDGVGILYSLYENCFIVEFQSFYANWWRWNQPTALVTSRYFLFQSFYANWWRWNWIWIFYNETSMSFQSFYANWWRWNVRSSLQLIGYLTVSILLCQLMALELNSCELLCNHWLVSILLCQLMALECV